MCIRDRTGDMTPVFDKNSVIEFRNVSFAYPGTERYVLKNLNLSLRGDEKLCKMCIRDSMYTHSDAVV